MVIEPAYSLWSDPISKLLASTILIWLNFTLACFLTN